MVSDKLIQFMQLFIPAVIKYALCFIAAIILHELAHAVHHRVVLKKWPKWGISKRLELVYVELEGAMTIYQVMINILIAIFVGAVFVSFFEDWILWFTYALACSYDIGIFVKLWRRAQIYGYHRTMNDVIKYDKDW